MALSPLDNFYINTYGPSGTNTLQHYYPLNESSGSALDAIGSLNGAITGSITQGNGSILPTTDGETCYGSNGSNSFRVSTTSPPLTSYPLSVDCWFRLTNTLTGATQLIWGMGGSSFNANVLSAYMLNNGSNNLIVLYEGSTGSTWTIGSLIGGTSHYLVFTTDGSSTAANTKMYLDASLITQTTFRQPGSISGTGSMLGSTVNMGVNDGWNGYAEKFGFYNAILTQAQVTANYNAGASGLNDVLMGTGAAVSVTGGNANLQVNSPIYAIGAQIAVTPGNAQLNVNTPLLGSGAQVAVTPGNANLIINTPFLGTGAQVSVTPGSARFIIGGGGGDTGGIDIISDTQSVAYGILMGDN